MPLRKDYICLDCNEVFEYAKDMGSGEFPDNPPCTKCESTNTKKYFGNVKKDHIGIAIPIYMRAGK